MVDKRGDPEVGDFGDQFWPLLKEWLTEFVVFLFYFEDLLTGLLVQPERKKITNQNKGKFDDWSCKKKCGKRKHLQFCVWSITVSRVQKYVMMHHNTQILQKLTHITTSDFIN